MDHNKTDWYAILLPKEQGYSDNSHRKVRDGWSAYFNPDVKRVLDVELVQTLNHDSVVCCVCFSHDGKYIATGSNKLAQIFDAHDGRKVCVFEIQRDSDDAEVKAADLYVRSVSFSHDGRSLVIGSEDSLVRVWDIATKTIRHTFSGHKQDIYCVRFDNDGKIIASGSADKTVRIWDVEKGSHALTLTADEVITCVVISPDSRYVAAGCLDHKVYVWDIHSGVLVEELGGRYGGHTDSIYTVAFSPDGKNLISGSLDQTIKMWELSPPQDGQSEALKGGKYVKMFTGHSSFVLSTVYTPDAEWILSGSKDRSVRLWDPNTGKFQFELQGHMNSVISVAASPKGVYFVTGSGDMKARIWSYRPF
ncbi:transcriptional regulatory protein rco1 [Claviceps sp. LM77 group G4]|nr:transcriptional regulatory protein rco1 [Claviceps sp. LM77 group G4]KAG6079709.1 transcriptional regulatory protein rco1 [Claviceps sp. LM78 group G4]KAG6085016.1 transcriptional regulatory protein rco1 [Claviceps sp. LM84 group G4]